MTWTREKEREQELSIKGRGESPRERLRIRLYGYHPEGYENECNGGEGCTGSEKWRRGQATS